MPPDAASAHPAIKIELLVRYLDAWLPAALHGQQAVFGDAEREVDHLALRLLDAPLNGV